MAPAPARKTRTAYKTADEKATTLQRKIRRATAKRRQKPWQIAATVALENGTPLTVAICITWSTCFEADRMEGHSLGLPEKERVALFWAALRRIAKKYGIEFIALRAPEFDLNRGHHQHLAAHMPDAAQRAIIRLLEKVTGAGLRGDIYPNGHRESYHGRVCYGVVARGNLGAWMLQKNTRLSTGGTEGAINYMIKGSGSEHVQTQYRLSNALSALVKAAQNE